MSAKQLAVIALAAAALTAAGCGGSSKSTTTGATAQSTTTATTTTAATGSGEEIKVRSGKPLSRAAWIVRGDAICKRANAALSSTTAKSNQDFARLLPQAAGYERVEATELSKLVPPRAKAGDWQQIITDLQKFSEFSIKAGEYAQVNNLSAATPIAQAGNKAQIQLITIAKRDGFKVCSIP